MTDQKNKLNKIKEEFSRVWIHNNWVTEKKVYIYDCPFSELHPEIKRRYENKNDFETYFENNIPLEDTFFIYVEYFDEFSGGKELKRSDIDENATCSQLLIGCTYKKMRDVYINVVFNNEQDRNDGVTFDRFVSYEIKVEDELYCLAELDYLDIPY